MQNIWIPEFFLFCLFLQVTNGVPQLEVGPYKLQLNKITVSDGNWHLFDVIITQKWVIVLA